MTEAPTERALVLGGGGEVGSQLVKRLKQEGHWVLAVDCTLDPTSAADEFIEGDASDPDVVQLALQKGVDIIFIVTGDAPAVHVNVLETLRDSKTRGTSLVYLSEKHAGDDPRYTERLYLAFQREYGVPVSIVRRPRREPYVADECVEAMLVGGNKQTDSKSNKQ